MRCVLHLNKLDNTHADFSVAVVCEQGRQRQQDRRRLISTAGFEEVLIFRTPEKQKKSTSPML
jgi:hypothetical protein